MRWPSSIRLTIAAGSRGSASSPSSRPPFQMTGSSPPSIGLAWGAIDTTGSTRTTRAWTAPTNWPHEVAQQLRHSRAKHLS
jgi:hypothetical protein